MANEKRLIDANELLRDINNYFDNSPFPHPGTNWRRGFEFAAELILFAPTEDAVEVVRCKDCKHWNEETAFCEKHSRFDSFGMDWNMFAEDDFCSYGERKDNV